MSLFSKKDDIDSVQQHEKQRSHSGRRYGIAEAILLMRTLPVDQNVELVVRTIRSTLESMGVHLSDIIEDSVATEKSINERISKLRDEIAELSKQVDVRSQEIARLETELAETTMVKERLQLAQHRAPPTPSARAGQPGEQASNPPQTAARSIPVPTPVKAPGQSPVAD